MPAPRAYPEAEVIARGLALEARGAVTPASLHQSLGGRGDRNTAFATWTAFIAHRGQLGRREMPATALENGFSPAVAGLIAEIIGRIGEVAETSSAERDILHERRAALGLSAADALLARNDRLEAEATELRAQVERLSATLAYRARGTTSGGLILP